MMQCAAGNTTGLGQRRPNLSTCVLVLTLGLVAALGPGPLRASDAAGEKQLQQAIDLLERKGEPARAAVLFQMVGRSSDSALAARALFYLAEAQHRQGKDREAAATYARIVKAFPAQRELVARAEERLTALVGPTVIEPVGIQRVASGDDADAWAYITADGGLLSRADRVSGDVVIHELRSGGRSRRLMVKKDTLDSSFDHAELPMVSPDGTKVVYVWAFHDEAGATFYQLRVVANEKGAAPSSLAVDPHYFYFEPIGWASDNSAILVTAWEHRPTTPIDASDFLWIPLNAPQRSPRIVKALGGRLGPSRPRLSPDGKYIAYSATPDDTNTAQEWQNWRNRGPMRLYVVPTDFSQRETAIIEGENINESPVWSPDGRKILFISNASTDGFGLWSVDIANGALAGVPSNLDANISSRIRPVGMTRTGTLYYVPWPRGGVDVLQAELNPVTGRIGAARRLLDSVVNRSQAPSFSPDGQQVAFKRRPAADAVERQQDPLEIVIYSWITGKEEKRLPTSAVDAGQVIWLRSERGGPYLLVRRRQDGGLSRLNLATNDLRPLESIAHSRLPPECGSHVLSPDSKTLYLSVLDPVPRDVPAAQRRTFKRTRRLVAFDMETGDQRNLFSTQTLVAMSVLAVSPDGRSLALAMQQDDWKKPRLVVMTLANGHRRQLAPRIVPEAASWTKAGLLVAADGPQQAEIVRISLEDSSVTPIGLSQARGQFFDVSPDGSRIVYSDRTTRQADSQLWAYRGIVPPLTRAVK
jgi:Tol biopolymer transport system component